VDAKQLLVDKKTRRETQYNVWIGVECVQQVILQIVYFVALKMDEVLSKWMVKVLRLTSRISFWIGAGVCSQ